MFSTMLSVRIALGLVVRILVSVFSNKYRLPLCTQAICSSTVAVGPGPVALGTAGNFAILSEAGISTIPLSAISKPQLSSSISLLIHLS
jgi:hypothetical protein